MSVLTWLPLLQEALHREGIFRWQVQGKSMVPTLQPGSVLEIIPPPQQLTLGEVVVFALGDELVVHRLVRYRAGCWITQGDGRTIPDPPITQDRILGIAVRAYKHDRPYWPGTADRVLAIRWVFRYHVGHLVRAVKRRMSGLLYG